MTSSDFVAWCTAYAVTHEPAGGDDAVVAFHREMNRTLDNAGSGLAFGFRFDTPALPSWASAWSPAEARRGPSQSASPDMAKGE